MLPCYLKKRRLVSRSRRSLLIRLNCLTVADGQQRITQSECRPDRQEPTMIRHLAGCGTSIRPSSISRP